jgi:hypothetical protein
MIKVSDVTYLNIKLLVLLKQSGADNFTLQDNKNIKDI